MAGIKAKGLNDLQLSMQEVANLPETVVENMLEAGGEIVVQAHRQQLVAFNLVKTGKLRGSIAALSKKSDKAGHWNRSVIIYPQGTHHRTKGRRQTAKTNKRSGKAAAVSASEVGFIHEYGAPKRRIKGMKWMLKANENSADAVVAAELRVYDAFLKSKEL